MVVGNQTKLAGAEAEASRYTDLYVVIMNRQGNKRVDMLFSLITNRFALPNWSAYYRLRIREITVLPIAEKHCHYMCIHIIHILIPPSTATTTSRYVPLYKQGLDSLVKPGP